MTDVLLKAESKRGGPASLNDYRDAGGYGGLSRAIKDMKSDDLIELVKQSGLRGRGGAGFPSGMKWSFVPRGDKWDGGPKYLLCNADEMEPGTFKDRVLLERNPHILIEGMILAARGMEMTEGYVFIRREYFRQADEFERALGEAREAKLLGDDVLGSGWKFDIHVHRSGGRYICGEETALINAFEGKRATPRAKPPFPATKGLWGRPTTVHNVETLSCVPGIVANGADWFKKLAASPDGAGTKLFGGSGALENPRCIERPIGTTLRALIDEMGGVKGGKELLAVIPGGASTPFLPASQIDTPMDFAALEKIGSRLGTGTFIVFGEDDCPLKGTLNLQRFFARESCGFCTPCRDGLPYGVEILARLERGAGSLADIDLLDRLYAFIGPNSFCALAGGAAEPIKGLLRHFRPLLEDHVKHKGCPLARREEVVHA